MTTCVIIPARLASTRLPGKVLLPDAQGRTILEHAWTNAIEANVGPVYIATPDKQIAGAASSFGARVIETGDHPNGTARVAEAASILENTSGAYNTYVNLQADEPELSPHALRCLAHLGRCNQIATLASAAPFERNDPSKVKAIKVAGFAKWFSRAPMAGALRHIGCFAYSGNFLSEVHRGYFRTDTGYSIAEGLEQLAWIEAGLRIRLGVTGENPLEINTPEDYALWYEKSKLLLDMAEGDAILASEGEDYRHAEPGCN